MEGWRAGDVLGVVVLSAILTATGVGVSHRLEVTLLPGTPRPAQLLLAGLIEEAFVRLAPLIGTFYLWSVYRGHLLTKTEGFLATLCSGVVVASLEVVIKLQYLGRLERVARFDALVLPVLLVHLPLALVAGRFAYALGARVHGLEPVSRPTLSRRTLALLVFGYLLLAGAHVLYNSFLVLHL